nr:MAG TPA: hypothetical protein [Caudoviricetes sp.]
MFSLKSFPLISVIFLNRIHLRIHFYTIFARIVEKVTI